MKISLPIIMTFLVLAQFSYEVQLGATHDLQHEFCWKDSYGRGVGTIPDDCGKRQKIGLLCYDRCPKGYTRFGFDCHQVCPSGFRDDGLYCRKAQYGRGAGYPWKFGDGLNDGGMRKRCQKDHGRGKCEKNGAIYYPKCKSGYHNVGCCICRPATPNCRALGMNGNMGISCYKYIKIGSPQSADCPAGKENNAGLCYKNCRAGYKGIGPVCWANTPSGWSGCGMGAAKDGKACASAIFSQITSVGQIAINIATLGTSSAATGAAQDAGKLAKLKQQLQTLRNAIKGNKEVKKLTDLAKKTKQQRKKGEKIAEAYEAAADAADAFDQLQHIKDENITEADIIRITASIAALADPTGIASAIEAYSHPKCSQIFKK